MLVEEGPHLAFGQRADEAVDPADLNLNLSASLPGNPGAFLRIPFSISNPAAINTLRFTARTSDGFTAWLNGTRITSLNAPADPLWNSAATSTAIPTRSSITDFPAASLVSGTNILAIQSLNNSPTDPNSLAVGSLDSLSIDPAGAYLLSPTPGAANSGTRTTISLKNGPVKRAATPAASSLAATAWAAR